MAIRGGFNVVEATLRGIALALKGRRGGGGPGATATSFAPLDFDYLVNLSGYTYPLASNAAITSRLASLPSKDTNLMEVDPQPSVPSEGLWHYYVECDDR
jgi:hypothetical protein